MKRPPNTPEGDWVLLGHVGVDSGQLMVTDPSYAKGFTDGGELLGHEMMRDLVTGTLYRYIGIREFASPGPEVLEEMGLANETIEPMPGSFQSCIPGTDITFNQGLQDGRLKRLPWPEDHSYTYRGACRTTDMPNRGGHLNYALGHEGCGVVWSSGFGDGYYEVWGKLAKCGSWSRRVVETRIVMVTKADLEDDDSPKEIEAWRQKAREVWADPSDNELEVDDDAQVNINEDGVWVQAWVWLQKEDEDG